MSFLLHWREDWEEFQRDESLPLWTTYVVVAVLVLLLTPAAVYPCLAGLGYLLFRRWMMGGRCRSDVRLSGKTALVTGGNAGIGRETALELSRRGARVIIASRNVAKSRLVAADIRSLTGNDVIVKKLDLASLQSVKELAADINASEPHLNILVNNAGLGKAERTKTGDGHETTLQVNYLGPWLLTHLLTDKLKKSAPSRIVNVSSLGHFGADFDIDDLEGDRVEFSTMKRYGTSKLLQILQTRQLDTRLRAHGVAAFALHPGVVDTEIGNFQGEGSWHSRLLKSFMFTYLFKSAKMGAQTTIYCCVEPSILAKSGGYFSDCAPGWVSSKGKDDQLAERVWRLTEKMLGV